MGTRKKKQSQKRKCRVRSVPPFPHELRVKVARLYVEDEYPAKLIAQQFNIREYSVYRWGKRYRQYGQQGLVIKRSTTVSNLSSLGIKPFDSSQLDGKF